MTSAEITRQHGVHEHGAAELLVAFEAGQLQLSLETPAFNLVGFGVAQTEDQQSQAAEVKQLLQQPQLLFGLAESGCVPTSTHVVGELFETSMQHDDEHDADHDGDDHDADHDDDDHDADHDDDDHDADHDDDDHDADHDGDDHDADHDGDDHDADHDGDDHDADHDGDDHDADHDGDDHDADHDHDSSHSDVDVEWVLQCEGLASLQQLEVNLFQHFEQLQSLDVQYLVGEKQGAQQLTAEQPVLRF